VAFPSESRRRALLALALVAFALALYLPVLEHDFVDYDDDLLITRVEVLRGGLTAPGVGWALTSTDVANWMPVTRLSWLLDAELFGLDPRGFHATSALLHALAAALLFLALEQLTGARVRSALVAAIFAAHPLSVEAVAWAAARRDVLSGVFASLSLLAYAAAVRHGGAARRAGVALALAAGLLSKPMLVTWPFVLLLLDLWPLGRLTRDGSLDASRLRRAVAEKWPLFALVLGVAVVTLATQSAGGALRSVGDVRIGPRVANALAAYAHYTQDVFWPRNLAVFYPYPGAKVAVGEVIAGAALLLCGSAAALWRWNRRPCLVVGWLWYVGMLVPVIGLLQVGQSARADRYAYLPLVGLALAVVWGIGDRVASHRAARRAAIGAALAAIAALAVATRAQLAVWQDSEALFLHALRVTEKNHVAHINLGLVYWRRERLDEASAHLLAGLRIAPRSSIGTGLLGNVRIAQGRTEEAIRLYRRALALEPEVDRWRSPLAAALSDRGRHEEAAAVLSDSGQEPRSER
jgi:tetratricopeptide (TPR) repeat protein